jgi:hypothetical protein
MQYGRASALALSPTSPESQQRLIAPVQPIQAGGQILDRIEQGVGLRELPVGILVVGLVTTDQMATAMPGGMVSVMA